MLLQFFLVRCRPIPPSGLSRLEEGKGVVGGEIIITLKRHTLKAALPRRGMTIGDATGYVTSLVRTNCRITVARDGTPRINVVRATLGRFTGGRPRCATSPVSMYATVDRKCVKCSLRGKVHRRLLGHNVCHAIDAILARIVMSPCSSTFCAPAGILNHCVGTRRTGRRHGGNGFMIRRPNGNFHHTISTPGPIGVIRLSTIGTLLSTSRVIVTTNNNNVPMLRRSGRLHNTDTIVRGSLTTKGLTRKVGTSLLVVLAGIRGMYVGLNGPGRRPLSAVAISRTGACVRRKRFKVCGVLPGFHTTIRFMRKRRNHGTCVASFSGISSTLGNGAKAMVR